jgi:glycosyltransferase involved in cell wall biosynthesis
MIKSTIIIYSDSIHSACSFWRSHGVFLELSRLGYVNIIEGTYNDSWTILRACDIAFFQRPISKKCTEQIFMAKDLGLKVWIDLDDYNIIPEHHPIYDLWKREYDELSFTKIMMLANIVTVTNQQLKNYYLSYSNNIEVIPNAINDYWIKQHKQKTGKNIFLRAGVHHHQDIYKYKDQIINIFKKYNDWNLIIAGSDPIFLKNEIKNYKFVGDNNIHGYFARILNENCSIFILPLIENKLNLHKSNIGWIEATISGSVALTPSWFNLEEESVIYKDEESFYNGLELLITNTELRSKLFNKSIKKIKSEYLLSTVNNQRIEIVKNLIQR